MSKVAAEKPHERLNYSNVHSCERCSYKTKSLFHMKNHVRRHQLFTPLQLFDCCKTAPEMYHCMKCNLKTNLMVQFYPHMNGIHPLRTNHKITKYECDKCKFQTFSALKRLKHAINECSHGKLPYIQFLRCKVCKYKFPRMSELKAHISNEHPDKVTWYQCKHCTFKTVWKGALKAHSVSHLDPKEITWHKCTLCSFKTKRKGNLTQHINFQHKDFTLYECDKCSFKTKAKSHLKKHALYKHTPVDQILKCSDCRYRTKQFSSLQAHCLKQHKKTIKRSDVYLHQCTYCEFKTKLRISLNQHVLQQHAPCDKILKISPIKKDMVYDNGTQITKGGFKCRQCIYRGERLSNLKSHVLSEHPRNVKWYTCDKCQFRSVWKGALKRHKEIQHVDFNPADLFKCKKCPYRAKERSALKQHMMIKHTKAEDAKWFECQRCEYKTKVNSHLNKHTLRLHMADDEVYHCEFCSYKSMRMSTLQSHVLKKHSQ